ncbi:hypothetical protein Q5698_08535 [Brucella intermedia]|uniref:hypothetical protein n=1 Tax=Brucella intermedia TaxID=94625 RepID=UPI0027332D55|nr:hypothetical protein [Brucella intermedia]WLF95716.1 hypothetical protein Q5698_08535 [Brucella intermedia]
MSCEACRAARAANGDLVAAINDVDDEDCACESFSMDPRSPGPVADDENLHLIVRDPDGLLENKHLNPVFVQQLFKNGMSVLRQAAADDEFCLTVEELQQSWIPKNKSVHGMLTFKAASVRYKDDQRLCCVYDTSLDNKPHHADMMAPKLKETPGVSLKVVKQRVVKAIIDGIGSDFIPAVEIRDGALKDVLEAA